MDKIYRIDAGGTKTLLTSTDNSGSMLHHVLDMALNSAGTMEVDFRPGRELEIDFLTDEITYERNGAEIFRGSPQSIKSDFNMTKTLTVTGMLDYLNDAYVEPYEFQGTITAYLQKILNVYNAHSTRPIVLGNVTVTDSNNNIVRSDTEYKTGLQLINEKLVGNLGGYVSVRWSNGQRVLDYLAQPVASSQEIRYGKNLLDISQDVEYNKIYTVLIPRGKTLDDGTVVDIKSVNAGKAYIKNDAAVAAYGWREYVETWSEVEVPANLKTKAEAYLTTLLEPVKTLTVKAVDLSRVSSVATFLPGNMVRTISPYHGTDVNMIISAVRLMALQPEDEVVEIGHAVDSFTSQSKREDYLMNEKITNAAGQATRAEHTAAEAIQTVQDNIVGVETWYYQSTSYAELVGGQWTRDASTISWEGDRYIWTKTVTVTREGNRTESAAVCVSGAKGVDAAKIKDWREYHKLVVVGSTPTFNASTISTWSTTFPEWQSGYNIWTAVYITFIDDSEPIYGQPVLAAGINQAMAIANNAIQVAGAKNKVYASTSAPNEVPAGTIQGDVWYYTLIDGGRVVETKMYVYDGSQWVQHVAGTTSIKDGVITTDKLNVTEIFTSAAVIEKLFANDINGIHGSFAGAVEAASGKIGHFTIDTLQNGAIVTSGDYRQLSNDEFELRGGVDIVNRKYAQGEGVTVKLNVTNIGTETASIEMRADFYTKNGTFMQGLLKAPESVAVGAAKAITWSLSYDTIKSTVEQQMSLDGNTYSISDLDHINISVSNPYTTCRIRMTVSGMFVGSIKSDTGSTEVNDDSIYSKQIRRANEVKPLNFFLDNVWAAGGSSTNFDVPLSGLNDPLYMYYAVSATVLNATTSGTGAENCNAYYYDPYNQYNKSTCRVNVKNFGSASAKIRICLKVLAIPK